PRLRALRPQGLDLDPLAREPRAHAGAVGLAVAEGEGNEDEPADGAEEVPDRRHRVVEVALPVLGGVAEEQEPHRHRDSGGGGPSSRTEPSGAYAARSAAFSRSICAALHPRSAAIARATVSTSSGDGGPALPRSSRRSTASVRCSAISSRAARRARPASVPASGRARGSSVLAVRHGGAGRASRRTTTSMAASAEARAVVYFTERTEHRPGMPSSAS